MAGGVAGGSQLSALALQLSASAGSWRWLNAAGALRGCSLGETQRCGAASVAAESCQPGSACGSCMQRKQQLDGWLNASEVENRSS